MRFRSKTVRLRDADELGQTPTQLVTHEQARRLLCEGSILDGALVPWGTNYTYYVTLQLDGLQHRAVYKPRSGEAPLIDFPSGTLYLREYAAYLVSEWFGWDLVPQTVIRADGPYGPGTVQIFVEAEGPAHVYSLRPSDLADLQKLALFDIIINNADRKPAHCFKGVGHGLWAIDHGLAFHARPKLRTVIWDFCGEPIPELLLQQVEAQRMSPDRVRDMERQLEPLLGPRELEAFWRRVDAVLVSRTYPVFDPRYNIPYGFA